MKKMSRSPERHTFGLDRYKNALESNPNDLNASKMLEFYQEMKKQDLDKDSNEEWKQNNLEYDLRTSEWFIEKICNGDEYAKQLYAALCNNSFQKLAVIPILKNQTWHCSWRYAGGIIADMRKQGDYIDWYCSGGEGTVTEEIREDLKKLGWIVVNETNL